MNWKRVFGRLHVQKIESGFLHSTSIEIYGATVWVYILVWEDPTLLNDFYITIEELDPLQGENLFKSRDWLAKNCIHSEEDFYGNISRIDLRQLYVGILTKLTVK